MRHSTLKKKLKKKNPLLFVSYKGDLQKSQLFISVQNSTLEISK